MSQTHVIRPCGKFEALFSACHYIGIYRSAAVTCRFATPPGIEHNNHDALKQILIPAMARVILDNPFLQVGIVDEDTHSPGFVYLPTIDLTKQVDFYDITADNAAEFDVGLARHIGAQHDKLWTEINTTPAWKFLVFPRPDFGNGPAIEIMIAYHHGIVDGISILLFHSKMLHALNHPEAGDSLTALEGDKLQIREPAVLPKSQEDIVPFTLSAWCIINFLWETYFPKWLKLWRSEPDPWTGNMVDFKMKYQTEIRIIDIPGPVASKMLAACRARSVTLTPLLNALVCVSFARRLPVETAPWFLLSTPISLRNITVKDLSYDPLDVMQNLVTTHSQRADQAICAKIRHQSAKGVPSSAEPDALIWEFAAELRRDLKRKLETLPADDTMGKLRLRRDLHSWYHGMDRAPRDLSWELSNPSVFKGNAADGSSRWKVTRGFPSQSATITSATVRVNVLGVAGGAVTICISWIVGGAETALVDGLESDLKEWTANFGKDETFGIFPVERT